MKQDPFPLHREHQAWQSEHQQWQRDLETWRGESAALTDRLSELLGSTMQRHERDLLAHAASIDTHETSIAEEQLGDELDEPLRSAHERNAAGHHATRARHTAIANALGHLRKLVSVLETLGMAAGEHEPREPSRSP
jgi:chromosome segregation ATPase